MEKLRDTSVAGAWSEREFGMRPDWNTGLTLQGHVVMATNLDFILLTVGSH